MKTKSTLFSSLLLLAWAGGSLSATPLGTAFTYQGQLTDGGQPAQGIYDLRFAIYDLASGGTLVAGPITNSPVAVSNGLFTVSLDFGASVFTGDARWLELGVRTNGSLSDFTPLTPRQPLTPAPYALHAPSAGWAAGASTAGSVAAGAVDAAGLQDGAVSSSKIAAGGIEASNVNAASFSNTFWKLDGNTGATPGTHFLGTTDNQPLELRVNGMRALGLQPAQDSWGIVGVNVIGGCKSNSVLDGVGGVAVFGGSTNGPNRVQANYSVISGGRGNSILSNAHWATISGGRGNLVKDDAEDGTIGGGSHNEIQSGSYYSTVAGGSGNGIVFGGIASAVGGGAMNIVGDNFGVVSGGYSNGVFASYAAIGGGSENLADGDTSTIAGGSKNTAAGGFATVGGGYYNEVQSDAWDGTIGGGAGNTIETNADSGSIGGGWMNTIQAGADYAAIPGGRNNSVSGSYGLAAGRRAQARHTGSFVWADSENADFPSTAQNQFLIRAVGGVGIGTNSPAAALHVAGTIRASAFEGDGAALENLSPASLDSGTASINISGRASEADVADYAVDAGVAGTAYTADYADEAGTLNGLSSAAFWQLGGNAGTTGGVDFLGTTDTQPLELKVNSQRVLTIKYNSGSPIILGGHYLNENAARGAVLVGGGFSTDPNKVKGQYSLLGGGYGNIISNSADWSVLVGGEKNAILATADYATIAGGRYNTVGGTSLYAAIGGGYENEISSYGNYAAIPGGRNNVATNYAFAAGCRAKANHTGAFVWGDSTLADIASTNANSVTLRASGGYRLFSDSAATSGASLAAGGGSWTSMSDRNGKENFAPVDPATVLTKVTVLPLNTWNYKSQDAAIRHIGPTAQDFKAAFDVGETETGITTIDADGVALAAIQGLNQKLTDELNRRDAEHAELKCELGELKQLVQALSRQLANLKGDAP